jgi:hypothetical protein
MRTSSQALYDMYDKGGTYPLSSVINLFGYNNWTYKMKENESNTYMLFDGLYKGLQIMGVSSKTIDKAFKQNKLDELIHKSYSKRSSGYYTLYCNEKICIGNTYIKK